MDFLCPVCTHKVSVELNLTDNEKETWEDGGDLRKVTATCQHNSVCWECQETTHLEDSKVLL